MTRRLAARVALSFACALASSLVSAATCYVKSDAAGSNAGTSWANAYTDLQSALGNYLGCAQVWVARGTYKPTATTDRTISFNVKPGVLVYGGFAGTEASLANRLLAVNTTILSGDIGVAGDSSDNSYHVVVMDGTTASGVITPTTLLADLTISDGNANGAGVNEGSGGGLYCDGKGAGHQCGPQLARVIFENNSAQSGGAMYNDGNSSGSSSPWVHDVIVRNNQAPGGAGGGMFNAGGGSGTATALIERVTFTGNSADLGGAIYNYGASGNANPTVRNSTFHSNTASQGGAMLNYGQFGHANPVLRYVTFTRNKATGSGGAIYNSAPSGDAAPNMSGMIFWADTPNEIYSLSATVGSIEYSITPECPGGAVGCINADPLLGPLLDNGGFAPSLRPQIGSPAIDAGNAVNCPADDQRGITRPQGAQCDLGAVELVAAEKKRCYVNSSALPPNDGLSWASPWSYLWQALSDTSCTEVWVAKGIYGPTTVGSTDRSLSFVIAPGKAVYGGFVSGATTRSERNPQANPTILTGELGAPGDASDNSYHVVALDALGAAKNITDATVLDGFTITGGNANGAGGGQNYGGGLICNGQGGYACSPTLANLVFSANKAMNGGAIANLATGGISSPVISSVTFNGNHADTYGGAIWNYGTGGNSSPVVSHSNFVANTAAVGGAIRNESASGTYTDDVFTGNSATSGGAVANFDSGKPGSPVFERVTFSANTATQYGGAVSNDLDAGNPQFKYVTFVDNSANNGGAVYMFGGATTFNDVLFLRNSTTLYGGGAISIRDSAAPVVDRATFIGNSAMTLGGAIDIFATSGVFPISNATFWKNQANEGGAISVSGYQTAGATTALRNVTFSSNDAVRGGAILLWGDLDASADLAASDVLFWGDSASSSGPEIYLRDTTNATIDHVLIQGGCPAGVTCTTTLPTDPLLGMLQYNGGFTPTLMPAANSLALNNGMNCAATDQRGVARPQGAGCDLGAVERRATEDYLFNSGFDF